MLDAWLSQLKDEGDVEEEDDHEELEERESSESDIVLKNLSCRKLEIHIDDNLYIK